MNPETFFDKFGLLADTPNGVQKLRELILQLAVHGKLVPQDPNDEPAAVLLEKIKVEKERLIKEKKIRKQKPLPSVKKDDYIFEMPKGWKWVHIGEMILVQGGKRLPQGTSFSSSPTSHIYIRVTDMKNGSITDTNLKYINSDVHQKIKKYIIEKDDLYITIAGTIGQVGEVPTAFHGMNLTENAAKLIFRVLNKKYVLFAMQSHVVQFQFKDKINQQAQPKLALKRIANTMIPLPPIEEQRCIVAKVDQLMALCDELEARQQKKQETRLCLNSAALDKLLTAYEPAEFAKHWQRVCENFDLLYDNPETVGELRKAILQLAVQGKLVRQDENDEPASDFLKRIYNQHSIVGVQFDEDTIIPPNIPDKWIWSRCEQLCQPSRTITYGVIKLGQSVESGVSILRSSNVRWLHIDEKKIKRISPTIANEYSRTFLNGGEILVTVRGTLGGVAVVPLHMKGFNISREVAMIPIKHELDSRFICFAIASLWSQNWLFQVTKGIAYAGINIRDLKRLPLPIPPIEEQRRIVARVDQLMALCDELESKLNQSQTDGAKLMEAVVAELIGA